MDPVRGLAAVPSGMAVGERQANGNKRQADAFRRALQDVAPPAKEGAVPPTLQPKPPLGRKSEGTARYVDVIA
jgi:hypothetical protein